LSAHATEPASALLMATLAATLLATAAGLMLIETRAARGASGESYRLARAGLEADRLLALATTRLDAGDPMPWQGVLFGDEASGRVLRQDAAGLVDVNAAPPERLAALFEALGVDRERAQALGDRIGDWRDEDNLTRLHGAEAAEYEQAQAAGPANRPFETEGELSRVLGMTPELLACALPLLTTYSGQAEIDAAAAPPRLAALLGLAPDQRLAAGAPLGRVIALTAEAPLSEHAFLRRTLWLRLTGDPSRPVLVHRAQEELAPRTTASDNACQGTVS
jgi:general secretion pathway protein K